MFPERLGRKMGKRPRVRERYREEGAEPLRVTLWLVPSVREEIREMASKTLKGTRVKRPRTGIVCTELICYALEAIHGDLK